MQILDSDIISNDQNTLLPASVAWWEKKRLLYNAILISLEAIMLFSYWEGTINFGLSNALFWSALYTFVANLCFSLGWGTEILIQYYLSKPHYLEKNRILLFIAGTLFSITLTFTLYADVLYRFQYFFF